MLHTGGRESREKFNTPPPPSPDFGQKAILRESGGGVFFEPPRIRNCIRPPLFIRPPPLEGYIQGWGGVYKIWLPREGIITIGDKITGQSGSPQQLCQSCVSLLIGSSSCTTSCSSTLVWSDSWQADISCFRTDSSCRPLCWRLVASSPLFLFPLLRPEDSQFRTPPLKSLCGGSCPANKRRRAPPPKKNNWGYAGGPFILYAGYFFMCFFHFLIEDTFLNTAVLL